MSLWMGDEVNLSGDDSNRLSFDVENAVDQKILGNVRHAEICATQFGDVICEVYATGGFGTKTRYTDYCKRCNRRSEPYTL